MKIDRLLGIITILTAKKKVKAKELAEKFEVSIRTIHRDIETISKAGIPVVTYSGGDRGIGILDGFKLDKNALTYDEMNNIILGLKSLESVLIDSPINSLLRKLTPESEGFISLKDDIFIDLTSYYKGSLAPKISTLRKAIAEKRKVTFCYYTKTGKTIRSLEPYFIAFKWSAWYVFGYCTLRDDFRLFKLNRLLNLELMDEHYTFRQVSEQQLNLEAFYSDPQAIEYATIQFDRSLEYVAIDSYGAGSYRIIDENTIEIEWDYVSETQMVKTILGFGSKAKVIAPQGLVVAVKAEAEKLLKNYKEVDILLS